MRFKYKDILILKMEQAIKLFSEGKLSLTEASNTAGISAGEMMDNLRKMGINSDIALEEIEESLENALKFVKQTKKDEDKEK